MEEIKLENSIEKPPKLYHGSSDKDIDVFEPRKTTFNHDKEGKFVIATPDKKAALPYLFSGKIDGERVRWSAGRFSDGSYYVVVPTTRDVFLKNDHGGAIYELPTTSFLSEKDRKFYEWYSNDQVVPTAIKKYDSVLDEWEKEGIEVYFLTEEQMAIVQKISSGNEKQKYLKSLKNNA